LDKNLKIRNDLYSNTSNVVAVLYDIENSSYEMLNYALGKAQKFATNIKVVSDWGKCPNQRRWNRLLVRKDLSFAQIERKNIGKNSLDNALFEAAVSLQKEGVQQFIIITTDTDFADIARFLHMSQQVYILGVGGICCNEKLRIAYDKFLYYPPGIGSKVAHDDDIPPGEPIEAVRERLLKAYNLAKSGKGWKILHSNKKARRSGPHYYLRGNRSLPSRACEFLYTRRN
jgi:predicted nuclease of predicted toxin-antitoxin system